MRLSNLEKIIKRKTDPTFDLLIEKIYQEQPLIIDRLIKSTGIVFLGCYDGSDAFDKRLYSLPDDSDTFDDSYDIDYDEELEQVKSLFTNDIIKTIENKPLEELESFNGLFDTAKQYGYEGDKLQFLEKLRFSSMFKEITEEIVKTPD
jgi:hypothetical protein